MKGEVARPAFGKNAAKSGCQKARVLQFCEPMGGFSGSG
jgi:hypothetical protein